MANKVAIGISVLNEEKNIGKLIESVLRQRTNGFHITEIFLLSDGSTDRTNDIMEQYAKADRRIKVLIFRERLGKPIRVNQLFKLASSDVMVILDGDVGIVSPYVISRLVTPILREGVDLTSGRGHYRFPRTFFERIMQLGMDMWSDVKESARDAEMYTCEGKIRAFSRTLYPKLKFPSLSAEDVYPYLYGREHGFKYRYVPHATVYYRLPTTFTDYVKQHTRFLHSKDIQSQNFAHELIKDHYTISWQEKVPVVFRFFLRHPILVSLYMVLLLVPKVVVRFESDSRKGDWSIIQSTKT